MNNIDAMKAYYEAKAQGGIVPYFQPIFSLKDDEVVAAETLCRISLPDGGLMTPDQFIPILEKTGEICDLDWYMAERACAMALDINVECDKDIGISFNLSPRHVYEWDAVEHLSAIADRFLVDHSKIEVEITESYDVQDYLLNAMIEGFREEGFSVALDDFGEGYATLGSIREVCFDTLKIDRSMVDGDFINNNSGAVIQSITDLANYLGVRTIGEGAETYEQLLHYIRYGCEFAQGNVLCRPLNEDEFVEYLQNVPIE